MSQPASPGDAEEQEQARVHDFAASDPCEQPSHEGQTTDAASVASGSRSALPGPLLGLWDGHISTKDLQEAVDTQRKEAHKLQVKRKAVLRDVKKQKRLQKVTHSKTSKLSTNDLLRELEFRAEHKAAVQAAAQAEAASSGSDGSVVGRSKKLYMRRGLV